jgi:hypothetical protein
MIPKGIFLSLLFLMSCGNQETWSCKDDGKRMYSVSSSGKLGGADKGCSCSKIRSFELRTSGAVDEEALKSDFGC